jgi:hypothetical protein
LRAKTYVLCFLPMHELVGERAALHVLVVESDPELVGLCAELLACLRRIVRTGGVQ